MKKLYQETAEVHDTTPEETEREIAKAIRHTYRQNPRHELFKNGLPSNQEFLIYVMSEAKRRLESKNNA